MKKDSFYKVEQKKVNKKDINLLETRQDIKDKMSIKMFPDDPEGRETVAWCSDRHREMDDSRPHGEWDKWYQAYESPLIWREDGLANINLRLEFATVRSKLADVQSSKTVVKFIPQERDDIYKRDLYRVIWDFVWTEADTEKELTNCWYSAFIFGTGIWFEGVKQETYTRYEPYFEGDEIKGKAVTETKSWLHGYALDIRDVWVDPVPNIEDAADCFIREPNQSIENIKALLDDPNYNHEAVEQFLVEGSYDPASIRSDVNQTFQTDEEAQTATSDKFTLFHYYNKEKGIYVVLGSGTGGFFPRPLREGPSPFPHGQLPISVLVDTPNYQELYGTGECELLEQIKYERNTVRNQLLDLARETGTNDLIVGEDVSFQDSELLSGVLRVWNATGNIGNTQFLQKPVQSTGLQNMEELLRQDATWVTGVDVNALAGTETKTAFEARLQEQNKLKGIMTTMRQFDYFLTRIARQRLANIQFFLPRTTGKLLTGKVGEKAQKKGFRTIPVQNKEVVDKMGLDDKTNKAEKKSITFKDREDGYVDFLELTPKLIKSNMDITVSTPTTTPVLRELNKYDLQEIFMSLMNLAQTEQGMKLMEKFNMENYFSDLIEQKGFDPGRYMENTMEEEEKENVRKDVMKRYGMPFRPKMSEEYAGQQVEAVNPGTPMQPQREVPQQRSL